MAIKIQGQTIKKSKKQRQKTGYELYWEQTRDRLEEKGYILKIRHSRLFTSLVSIKSPVSNTVFIDIEKKHMSIGEFKRMVEDGKIRKNIANGYLGTAFNLENNSGFTELSIFKGEKLVSSGEARVHPNDHFVRKIGLAKAVAEAVRNMNKNNE